MILSSTSNFAIRMSWFALSGTQWLEFKERPRWSPEPDFRERWGEPATLYTGFLPPMVGSKLTATDRDHQGTQKQLAKGSGEPTLVDSVLPSPATLATAPFLWRSYGQSSTVYALFGLGDTAIS